MDKVLYAIFWCLSLLPFRVLYWISDALSFLLYRVVGYRKKIVRKNLKNSFPEKTEKELRKIEKEFYQHFCDCFFETIKCLTMKPDDFRERMRYVNPEELERFKEKNQSFILYLGHYGNWEWLTFGYKYAPKTLFPTYIPMAVYHKLESGPFDKFYLRLRLSSGAIIVPQKQFLRTYAEQKQKKQITMYCFNSDHGMMWENMYFWMKWLNQDTAPEIGPEKIARRTKMPVLYIDVQKPSRGHYTARFVPLTDDANELEEFELTRMYMRKVEESIRRNPAYWMWTHNRWKRTPERFAKRTKLVERNRKIQEEIEARRKAKENVLNTAQPVE